MESHIKDERQLCIDETYHSCREKRKLNNAPPGDSKSKGKEQKSLSKTMRSYYYGIVGCYGIWLGGKCPDSYFRPFTIISTPKGFCIMKLKLGSNPASELQALEKQARSKVEFLVYEDEQEANTVYTALEDMYKNDSSVSVVLVVLNNFSKLKQAYPNYFWDAGLFTKIIRKCLGQY